MKNPIIFVIHIGSNDIRKFNYNNVNVGRVKLISEKITSFEVVRKLLVTGTQISQVTRIHISYSPRSFFNRGTYFTGLSNCHKLVLPVFKTKFLKTGPKEMMQRNFKNFAQAYRQKLYMTIPVLKRIS